MTEGELKVRVYYRYRKGGKSRGMANTDSTGQQARAGALQGFDTARFPACTVGLLRTVCDGPSATSVSQIGTSLLAYRNSEHPGA